MSMLEPVFALETDRLRVRHVRDADADAIYAHCREPALTAFTTWEHHDGPQTAQAFVRAQHAAAARGDFPTWAIADRASDELVGAIGLYDHVPSARRAEFGFWLGLPHQGRGLATEAARAVVTYGLDVLGLVRVQAICHVDNAASARVLTRAGLNEEGILRKYAWKRGRAFDVRIFAAVAAEA